MKIQQRLLTALSLIVSIFPATASAQTAGFQTSQPESVSDKTGPSAATANKSIITPMDPNAPVLVRTLPKNLNRPTVAVALGGGGTRGLAHIGVLRALEKANIPIDCIVGTSIGAIIGGLYASDVSLDEIQTLILNRSLLHSYDTVPISLRCALIPIFYIPHLIGYHPLDGLYRGKKFAKFINNHVQPQYRLMENSKIPLTIIASDLLNGKVVCLQKGSLGRAVQASAAVPFLRRPVLFEDDLLVDGGILMNLPVEPARATGADIVIAVDVDETFSPVPISQFRAIGSVSRRAISMLLTRTDKDQLKLADVLIHPDTDGIGLLSRDMKLGREAILKGEKAGELAVPKILQIIEEKKALAKGRTVN